MQVKVTVAAGRKTLALEDVTDARLRGPLQAMAADLGRKLGGVRCPEHGKPATNVRIHVDARGAADLKYDSCCEALGGAIAKVL